MVLRGKRKKIRRNHRALAFPKADRRGNDAAVGAASLRVAALARGRRKDNTERRRLLFARKEPQRLRMTARPQMANGNARWIDRGTHARSRLARNLYVNRGAHKTIFKGRRGKSLNISNMTHWPGKCSFLTPSFPLRAPWYLKRL